MYKPKPTPSQEPGDLFVNLPEVGGNGGLEIKHTDEGMILDCVDGEGNVIGTMAMTYDEWWAFAYNQAWQEDMVFFENDKQEWM